VTDLKCRLDTNDSYLRQFGLDFPYVYYRDAQGLDTLPQTGYPNGVTWYDFRSDLLWMRDNHKRRKIGWVRWIGQLARGYDNYAVFSWRDPYPFMHSLFGPVLRPACKSLSSIFRRRYEKSQILAHTCIDKNHSGKADPANL
jgi:hypothetical protein